MKLLGRRKNESEEKPVKKDKVVSDAKPKETKTDVAKTPTFISARRIIIRPLVTEKAARLSSEGKYVFEVAKDAGRVEVQQSIAKIYGVRPVAVNIQNYRGKRVRFGRRFGQRKSWKKAIITLAKGEKIDVHEGV